MNELANKTRMACLSDLEITHGTLAGKRFLDAIDVKEVAVGRKLKRSEIIDLYHSIDEEYFMMLVSCRKGK